MATDARTSYDRYWEARDRDRTVARSRERGEVVARLLGEPAGRRLVDVGCGPGWALEELARVGFCASGFDVSAVAVAEATGRGLDVRQLDLEKESLATALAVGGAPDVIVSLEVLEHLLDPLGVLRSLAAARAPGGTLVVSLPNELALPARIRLAFGRMPFGGHDDPHLRHFDRRRALRLFSAAELEVVAAAPIAVLPPRWRFLRALTAPLLRLLPGLFAIAIVYELRDARNSSEARS